MELLRMLALLAGTVGLLRHDLDSDEEYVDVDDNDVEVKYADVDGDAQGRRHHHRECNHHKGRGYQCPPTLHPNVSFCNHSHYILLRILLHRILELFCRQLHSTFSPLYDAFNHTKHIFAESL